MLARLRSYHPSLVRLQRQLAFATALLLLIDIATALLSAPLRGMSVALGVVGAALVVVTLLAVFATPAPKRLDDGVQD